jgi:hypothetical protein
MIPQRKPSLEQLAVGRPFSTSRLIKPFYKLSGFSSLNKTSMLKEETGAACKATTCPIPNPAGGVKLATFILRALVEPGGLKSRRSRR